jgi:hypothetical protein
MTAAMDAADRLVAAATLRSAYRKARRRIDLLALRSPVADAHR